MAKNLRQWLHQPLPFGSLYIVVGEEDFLIHKIIKTFRSASTEKEGIQDFNQEELEGSELTLERFQNSVETLSLLSQKRIVFCRNAQSIKDKLWKKIEPLLHSLPSSCVVVFFFTKVDRRKKYFKILKSKGEELLAEPPKEREMDSWIDLLSQEEGFKLSPEAKKLFHQLVGTNLMDVKNEMRKIKAFIGERSLVQEQDLFSIVSRARIESVFNLTRAIGQRDLVKSLRCLAHLLEQNQNELGVLALIARHIRILSRLREGQKQGFTKQKMQVFAGVSPYFIQDYLEQIKLWSDDHILETIEALHETDKALKSSPVSSPILLENFLLKACTEGA